MSEETSERGRVRSVSVPPARRFLLTKSAHDEDAAGGRNLRRRVATAQGLVILALAMMPTMSGSSSREVSPDPPTPPEGETAGATTSPPARPDSEGAPSERPAPSKDEASGSGVTATDGILKNAAYGFRFTVPTGWTLTAHPTDEEMVMEVLSCPECVLRVLVFPGEAIPLEDTMRALKKQVLAGGDARILDEQRTKVAGQRAYTLVKEETVPDKGTKTASGGPSEETGKRAEPARLLSRYVTFNHQRDKYYLLLRSPSARFGEDEDAAEKLLESFHFASAE